MYPGTRHLQRHQRLLRSREADLKKKYHSYEREALNYNGVRGRNRNHIQCPTFDEVKAMLIDDHFWDFGQLTHPDERWANDPDLQAGIKAHLDLTHAEDEIRRIGRECRQIVNWAAETNEKILYLRNIVYSQGV